MRTRRTRYVWLSCLALHILTAAQGDRSRFDPPFRNELHAPRAGDAQIVQFLKSHQGPETTGSFALVHGHFLGDGTENVVVATFWPAQGGEATVTSLFSKGTSGWKLEFRHDSLNVAYCRVVPVSSSKDILLCQTDYVGPTGHLGNGEVDTHLYTVDFTRDPADTWFLELRDTVRTGARCRSWASLKSVGLAHGSLHVLVEYGRNQLPPDGKSQAAVQHEGSPSGFPRRLYDLDFEVEPTGLVPAKGSQKDLDYITARWEAGSCPDGQ
ncbi:MAG TPA: hypothetical protein VHW09_05505 [Bryobacteraceae bacterium]|nr:hypothetical protein [Bryobacteraceae bacterium]